MIENSTLEMKIKTIRMNFSKNCFQSLSVLDDDNYKFGNTNVTRKELPNIIEKLLEDINEYVIKNTLNVLGDFINKGILKISHWIKRIVLLYNTEVDRSKSEINDSTLYFFAVTNFLAMSELLKLLKETKNQKLRYKLIFIFGELHNYYTPEISDYLQTTLKNSKEENEEIRAIIALTLGKTKDQDAVDLLIKTSKDDSWRVSFNSLYALGEIRSIKSLPTIVEFLNHDNEMMRGEAAIAIGKFGEKARKEIIDLIKLLSNNKETINVKQKIIIALTNNRICESVPTFLTLIKENNEISLTKKCIEALGIIYEKCENVVDSIPLLLHLYFDKKTDQGFKITVLNILSKISPIPISELLSSYKPKEPLQPFIIHQHSETTSIENLLESKNKKLWAIIYIELAVLILGIVGNLIASLVMLENINWYIFGVLLGIALLIIIINIVLKKKGKI